MKQKVVTIDWNKMNKWGLIYEINQKVLHPLGLSMSVDVDTGSSDTIYVDCLDHEYTYSDEVVKRNEDKLKKFKENRNKIFELMCNC